MQNLTNPTICQAFWLTRNTEIAQFYLNPIMAPLVYHWQFDMNAGRNYPWLKFIKRVKPLWGVILYDNVKYTTEYGPNGLYNVLQTKFAERANTSQSDIPHLNSVYVGRTLLFSTPNTKWNAQCKIWIKTYRVTSKCALIPWNINWCQKAKPFC